MTVHADLEKWWEHRSEDERANLKQAARQAWLDGPTFKLLFDTRCPDLPVTTQWRDQVTPASPWPSRLRAFIGAQD
ncbi:hypothetical protein H7K38_04450 [Mycobacterium alsense]|uniref:Uncharacterized protein n=1 Tax=Mycobacterium alsense TaxID=324058 RepID=A0AA42BXS6_9MYCO|nr:hypothetical protein [Mycobacterium alsense]MCV7377903.1 hypothetical protein [Mycobacterium alsense]